jgi:5-amino-6-(5-phospho-D-ribitylamino)uracil phosphatase
MIVFFNLVCYTLEKITRFMKPLFITDLDHTLLRSDQTISPYTTKIWNELNEHAILSIATARSFHKVKEFLRDLELNAPMILLDGTMIVTPDKEIIDLKLITKELSDAVIHEGAKLGIYPFVIGLQDDSIEELFWYPKVLNEHQSQVLLNYKNDPRLSLKDPIIAMNRVLKVVYFGSHEVLEPLTGHLKDTFGDALEYKLSPENYGGGWFLTILHPHGDKSHALKTVTSYLGHDIANMTVFGDSVNDIEMFKLANTSIAVQNALDEVKAVASIVLPHTNDDDAVAKYLSQFIKG